MNTKLKIVLVAVLGIIILPALLTSPPEHRVYSYTRLEDTTYQSISFYNAEQDLNLGGMLFVPEGEGPFPAAIVIQGSGTSHRGNGWYLTLTAYLQENGIVVLLPDKRGSEQSEGDWNVSSFEDLATDTQAAIDYLQEQDVVDIVYIGVVGLSQGGHIAPIVASQSPDVAFVVNVVGSSLPMHELLVYEENNNLREIGVLPGISNVLSYVTAPLVRVVQKDFWDAIGNFDPLPYWQETEVDTLVLYGELDTNVPAQASADRLNSLNKSNIETLIYAGSGHALQDPEGEGDSLIREAALTDIVKFIFAASVAVANQ